MRTPVTDFNERFVNGQYLPIHLYEINYDGTDWLYFTDNIEQVSFDSKTYIPFPIKIDTISESREGSINGVKLSVSNAARFIGAYVEEYDGLRRKTVIIRTVFPDLLDNTDAQIQDKFQIDSCTIGAETIEFSLSPVFDLLEVVLPYRRFLRDTCFWKFKGTECAYSGADTTCGKRFNDCKDKLNQARYGGFPGVPGNGTVFR